MKQENPASFTVDSRSLPVEYEADLVVAGASFAGISMALNAGRAGFRAALVEPRIYPGYEVSALVRPWISEKALTGPPSSIAPWIEEAAAAPAGAGELAILPDCMKRRIEEELVKAGVMVYYGSQSVGVVKEGEKIAGLVMANKSGRQAVLAKCVVDTTPWGTVARMAGVKFGKRPVGRGGVTARRTLEFTRVKAEQAEKLRIPARLKAGRDLKVRRGAAGGGHYLLEARLPMASRPADYRGLMRAEIEARNTTIEIVKHVLANEPAFEDALFAQASWELFMASPWVLTAAEKGEAPGAAFVCRGHPELMVLSGAAARDEREAEEMLDPLVSAKAGDEAWPNVKAILGASPRPAAARSVASCGKKSPGAAGRLKLMEQRVRAEGCAFVQVKAPAESVPVLATADVVVAGGGTGGPVASAVAARSGASAVLLEMNSGLGGTGTLGGVNVYWMSWRQGFSAEVDVRVAEQDLDLRTPPRGYAHGGYLSYWGVEAKMHALLKWNLETGVDVLFRALAVGTITEGDVVKGVLVATPDGLAAVFGKVIVDATGDGDVAAWAGARYSFGSSRDSIPMWSHVAPVTEPGVPQNAHTTAADVTDVRDFTRMVIMSRRRSPGYDHGVYLAPRESRRITGDLTVTLTDNLVLKEFEDAVVMFMSNPDVKGMSDSKWFNFGIQTPHCLMELPYRALLPAGLEGIIVGGKSFSASHDAISAMRMQPDIQNLGGTAGLAAARALREGVHPRHIDVLKLQKDLVRLGVIPAVFPGRKVRNHVPSGEALEKMIANVTGEEPLYYEQIESSLSVEPLVTALLCAADSREAVPILAREHSSAQTPRKLLLARLLAWHGSMEGSATLLEEARRELSGGGLPPRRRFIRNTGKIIPDQGAMPELVNILYTLGMAGEMGVLPLLAEIAGRLDTSYESFKDAWKGTFYYAEAVCCLAERFACPEAVPMLEKLHSKPGLNGLVRTLTYDPDPLAERNVYLELAIGRALARCGSPRGVRILVEYLDEFRSYYARHAYLELVAVAGEDLGREKEAWERWLDENKGKLEPRPWTEYAY